MAGHTVTADRSALASTTSRLACACMFPAMIHVLQGRHYAAAKLRSLIRTGPASERCLVVIARSKGTALEYATTSVGHRPGSPVLLILWDARTRHHSRATKPLLAVANLPKAVTSHLNRFITSLVSRYKSRDHPSPSLIDYSTTIPTNVFDYSTLTP